MIFYSVEVHSMNNSDDCTSSWIKSSEIILPISNLINFLFTNKKSNNINNGNILIFGSFGFFLSEILTFNNIKFKNVKINFKNIYSDIDIKITSNLENIYKNNINNVEKKIYSMLPKNKKINIKDFIDITTSKRSSTFGDMLAIGNIKNIYHLKINLKKVIELLDMTFNYSHPLYSFKNIIDLFFYDILNIDISVDFNNDINLEQVRPISLGRFGILINANNINNGLKNNNICILGSKTLMLDYSNNNLGHSIREYKLFLNTLRRNSRRNENMIKKIMCYSADNKILDDSNIYDIKYCHTFITDYDFKNPSFLLNNLQDIFTKNEFEISYIDSSFVPFIFNIENLLYCFLYYLEIMDYSFDNALLKIKQFCKINFSFQTDEKNNFKDLLNINNFLNNFEDNSISCQICSENINKKTPLSLLCIENCHYLCLECSSIFWNSTINDINNSLTKYFLTDDKIDNMKLIDICNWHTGRNVSCCPVCRDSYIPKMNVQKSDIPLSFKTSHNFCNGKKLMLDNYLELLNISTESMSTIDVLTKTPLVSIHFLPKHWIININKNNKFNSSIKFLNEIFFNKIKYIDIFKDFTYSYSILYNDYIKINLNILIKNLRIYITKSFLKNLLKFRKKIYNKFANIIIKSFNKYLLKKLFIHKNRLNKEINLLKEIFEFKDKNIRYCLMCKNESKIDKLKLCSKCINNLKFNKKILTLPFIDFFYSDIILKD